ncbi:hypothetical protein PF005_g30392 [Phytophthora fragariae]|nr:hypothetical protein PF003_g19373 [Phytophthora fragariae]KAE8944187.1 hypothetical protein PF009_g6108 [Phytophthora fragariae]KAE8961070.1 hypothetical protein PF011_g29883 [Phytophthora fragariae]KAE9066600.1 hypothetical protein PF006_g30183 [Phytophthora fragariae]KAE9088261.1 hypothetical protein PF007_g20040 [Phytophthora fragariae]
MPARTTPKPPAKKKTRADYSPTKKTPAPYKPTRKASSAKASTPAPRTGHLNLKQTQAQSKSKATTKSMKATLKPQQPKPKSYVRAAAHPTKKPIGGNKHK